MRSFGLRLSVLVAILGACVPSTAWAWGHHGGAYETVYVMPTTLAAPVATSYVVSTSLVRPTAYAVPTYYTTAYWMDPVVVAQPTGYVATTYVRRGLFGRRWVEERPVVATYLPTTYYAPLTTTSYRTTSYVVADPMVVATSYVTPTEYICESPVIASSAPVTTSPRRSVGSSATVTPRSQPRRSQPVDRGSISSDVTPPNELEPIPGAAAGASELPPMPDFPRPVRDTSPPPPPAQTQTQPRPAETPTNSESTNATTGQPGGVVTPPSAPGGSGEGELRTPPPIGTEGTTRRESMRPSNYAAASRPIPPEYRNVLIGTVVSSAAGEPEEGVEISVRNPRTGATKSTSSNAFGRFAMRLSEGDWDVEVAMPSGRVYTVSRLRVSDGLIRDARGRRVPSLDITR